MPPAIELTSTEASISEFWSEIAAQTISWMRPWDKVLSGDFTQGNVRWFDGAQLNVSVNCLDRHLANKGSQRALIWQGDNDEQQQTLTFRELHAEVCRMANVLKRLGVKKGDVVAIYLPMIPEAAIAMLACARIGAVHTVVFAGFSSKALQQRIEASACHYLITLDNHQRGGKNIALKQQADEAIAALDLKTLVIQMGKAKIAMQAGRDYWWHEERLAVDTDCPPEPMEAEDSLFILYTSGSTGKPKGLIHTTGGYIVQAAYSHQLIFACNAQDVYWCTADIGWITGHSYVVYGPLCNGITTLMYEGVPHWPDAARNWQIIDKYQVSVFYTAPTAIRALMRAGDNWLDSSSRHSLRLLGTVGEPINPEAWQWYYQRIGLSQCPVMDTWWQTETGAIMISPRPCDDHNKPGAAQKPLPGIVPVLLDDSGFELQGVGSGLLAIKYPWPSMARTIAGDHQRYLDTYFSKGYYITGDGARRDEDEDYWITGRVDDVLNVSGHRLGTAEIESALVSEPLVVEAAVVGVPHEIKGQGICAFVVLKQSAKGDERLILALNNRVRTEIGPIAKPDAIYFLGDLPRTRSGKIMRRILRKIAAHEVQSIDELGDLSTLVNPEVVAQMLAALK